MAQATAPTSVVTSVAPPAAEASDAPPVKRVPPAKIEVHIISATGLRDADCTMFGIGGGSSDPFCRVYLDGKKNKKIAQTKVIKNCLKPVWDHPPFVVDIGACDSLIFEVRDSDPAGMSDFLGKVVVEADRFIPNGYEGEFNLEDTKGKDSKLKLKFVVKDLPDALVHDMRLAGKIRGNGDEDCDGAIIEVCIHSAKDLRDADRGPGGGSSDPFCVLYKAGVETKITQTVHISNSLHPVWEHKPIQMDNFDLEDALIFEVRDRDPGGFSDLLGRVRVEAEKLLPYGFKGEIDLEDTKGKRSKLIIHVECKTIPKALRKAARRAAGEHELDELRKKGAIITLEIKGATGLRNADRMMAWLGGKSDPYCICKQLPDKVAIMKTKVIDNNLNPVWDCKPFVVDHIPLTGPALHFEVRDKDPGRAGELLGECILDSSLFLPNGFKGSVPLQKGGKGCTPQLLIEITGVQMPPEKAAAPPPSGLRGVCIACCGAPDLGDMENLDPNSVVGMMHHLRAQALDLADKVDDVVEDAVIAVEDAKMKFYNKYEKRICFWKNFSGQLVAVIDKWMKTQIMVQLEVVLNRLPAIIKSNMNSDVDMIRSVWKTQCKVVDVVWPDILTALKRDLEQMFNISAADPVPNDRTDPGKNCITACFRYLLFPFDKSFWGKAKSPMYFIMAFFWYLPISAPSALMMLITFLAIDKRDEYSLVQFILSAKSTLFVSHFFMRMFIGYLMYLGCAMKNDNEIMTCDTEGPSVIFPAEFVMIPWLIIVLLPWLATFLLPCARAHKKQSGGGKGDDDDDDDDLTMAEVKDAAGNFVKGMFKPEKRFIRYAMYFDAVCMSIGIAILAWKWVVYKDADEYMVRQTFYAIQVTYGLLSVPFFLFCLPVADKVLLGGLRRTGYDDKGRCRFWTGAIKPTPPGLTEDVLASFQGIDQQEILDSVMGVFGYEKEVKEDDLWHEFEVETLVKKKKCKRCNTQMKGGGKEVSKCNVCENTYCPSCATACGKKIPCPKKEELLKKQKGELVEAGQTNTDKQDAAQAAGLLSGTAISQMWQLEEYFKITKTLVSSLTSMDSKQGHEKWEEFMELVRTWVKRQSHGYIEVLVAEVPGVLKDNADEPDMPVRVREAKDAMIDTIWEEMHEEIMYSLQVALDGKVVKEEDMDATNKGVDCIRARLRYAFMPYDKSIFWQIHNPWFWFLTLLPLIPVSICVPFTFLLIFIFIDKMDEFQLVNFILRFKGAQFISLGLIKNVIGFYGYLACTSNTPPISTCPTGGPGTLNEAEYQQQLWGLIVQILLTWAAFLCLPFSKDKGRVELAGALEAPDALTAVATAKTAGDVEQGGGNQGSDAPPAIRTSETSEAVVDEVEEQKKKLIDLKQGGRLRWFFFYDIITSCICFGILFIMYGTHDWRNHWTIQQGFFAIIILYGYLAFPFFLFNLPVLKTVLTHSAETGYDSKGRIRALEGPKSKPQDDMDKVLKEIEEADIKKLERKKQRAIARGQKVEDPATEKGLLDGMKEVIATIWKEEVVGDDDDKKNK